MFFHIDFVDSGLVAALCDAFIFPFIGMTSMACADECGYGLFDLTLTVLTSDEVSLEVGMTNSITHNNYEPEVNALFTAIRSRVDSDPSLIISFIPFIREVSGYEVVAAMDKSCGGIPIWGSITNNVDFSYETVQIVCNGENLRSGIAMMFNNGSIQPSFVVSSLPELIYPKHAEPLRRAKAQYYGRLSISLF